MKLNNPLNPPISTCFQSSADETSCILKTICPCIKCLQNERFSGKLKKFVISDLEVLKTHDFHFLNVSKHVDLGEWNGSIH